MGILPLKRWKLDHWAFAACLGLHGLSSTMTFVARHGYIGIVLGVLSFLTFAGLAVFAGAFRHE